MTIIALQSGSNGNCIYVESKQTRLLFDAGISGAQAEKRLAAFGRDIRRVQAVIISHEHSDHISQAGVYQRKFGLPLYVTEPTLAKAKRRRRLGKLFDVRHFHRGQSICFDNMRVETIPTPHDGIDSTAFVIENKHHRVGILTDMGHVFTSLPDIIASLHAVLIESNYDSELLESGPYPPHLKQRIRSPKGHLSNLDSAQLLRQAETPKLTWACLSHLSEQNNTPALALRTHREQLPQRIELIAASRYEAVLLPEL